MRYHADWRRQFWGDIFPCESGDINIVRPAWGVFIGWHRHQRQHDALFLVSGALRVRYFKDSPTDGTEITMAPGQLPVLIAANLWHGYEALTPDTIILQFNGPGKYDGTDEERMSVDEMPWIPTP